jgi:predicted ATPase/DNA-binding XRE family transcriptional regulator
MDTATSFGEWLTRRRKSLDLTRDELARRVACSVSTLRRLEADDLRASPALAELLARELDVPADERAAFVAFARGQRAAFDAKPGSAPSHLPAPLTELVGRQRELVALADLLRKPGIRLLTLSGPPGTGKTRLSIAVGHKLARAFRDGAHFVALEPISEPGLVAATIAQTLGVKETRVGIARALADFLRDKNLLLILDNFEHLIPAAPVVNELLTAAPQLKVLVTSREILHLYGEHEFPVPPLEMLNVRRLPTPQSLALYARYSSIEFFVERARAVKPDFRLTAHNAADIARICAWLDGLPLALEIAAAQIKWHTPSQLLAQLSDRLRALTGGPRDLTPRQQSLRGAIDWSYDLLDEDERRLFEWLGIFWDGCGEAAIAEFRIQNSEFRIENPQSKIQNLVEKSLVRHELDAEGNARYTMLEMMRDYARDKLRERGEWERARQWHAEYFVKFAQTAYPHILQGDEQIQWLNRLEREHNNLRAVLAWMLESPARAPMAFEFAVALRNFWHMRGYYTEGRQWLEQILALDTTPSALRARVLSGTSDFASAQGDDATAQKYDEESLAIAQALGDEPGIYFALDGLGILAGRRGDYARAAELLEQVLVYRRKTNDPVRLMTTLNNLAIAVRRLKNFERAKELCAESIALAQTTNNRKSLAHAYSGMGEVCAQLRQFDQASQFHRQAITLRHELGDLNGLRVSFNSLAVALDCLGASIVAVQLSSASEKIQRALNVAITAATRVEHADFIAQLRAKLGDAEFERAWTEGQTLTVEQAVAFALEQ